MFLWCVVWFAALGSVTSLRGGKRWQYLLLCFGLLRIGEASNPGPVVDFEADQFTVGTFNPTGLRNKAHYFHTHMSYGDIWTAAETHFYGKDVSRFRAGLRASHSARKYCITDAPSTRRQVTSQSAWKGVGVLAKHPTRALPSSLPEHIRESGRALLFTSLLGDTWLSGAVVYGEPNAHHYPAFLKNNEHILHHVATHICHLTYGPRFISGDWNVEQGSLPVFGLLTQAGFRDIQDVALERWGCPIQNTCKGRTRRDFLYISPEMQDLLLGVDVCHDTWPDHSMVVGSFRGPRNVPPIWVWPTPEPFPWPNEFAADVVWPGSNDASSAYAQVWEDIENSAIANSPFEVSTRACGRASRTMPMKVRNGLFAPVKLARKGDFQPEFFGASVRHSQWLRQVRRLQSFARLAGNESPALGIVKAETWGAIRRARGFDPSFEQWWESMCFKTNEAPLLFPLVPPAQDVAHAMFESVAMAVRDMEGVLRKSSRQYAKLRRDHNPNLVFSDIRPPSVPGVDVLLQPLHSVVESEDVAEGRIVLDQPCSFDPEGVISCDGRPLEVIHHESDAVWVSDASNVAVGAEISQQKCIGSHADLEALFVKTWSERWMRHADVPAERWEVIVAFARNHLPRLNLQWPSIGVAEIQQVLRSKKKSTSPGFDGVTLLDLQRMPANVLQVFCDMFASCETTGSWPMQLVDGRVVSLAKVSSPGSPADFRPVTVFSLLYRVWSSYHSKQALSQLDSALPDTLYGGRPGRYAAQVWSKLLWSVEHSFQHGVELTGIVADLQKAFNMLPRLVVFELAGHLGLPGPMLIAWAGALSRMKRRFLLRGSLTKGVLSVTGFPEGCGLSCVAMVIVDFAFHVWQRVFFPLCTALSYVDDWQLVCTHSSLLSGAKRCLDRFVEAVDLQLDAKKTFAWSITNAGRKLLREEGFTVVLAAKNLGAHVQVSRKHTNASLTDRIGTMVALWPRLRLSPCAYRTKVRALLVAAWPRALHAVAATGVGDHLIHSLRAGAMKGLDSDGAGCNAWVQLGLIEHPQVDPGFWTIVQSIRCARDCGDPVQIREALCHLTMDPEVLPETCITVTLLHRLQSLGWHIDSHGVIHDVVGKFGLFEASMAEIVLRAQWAWQGVVAQKVVHRPGFADLHMADALDTRSFLRNLSGGDLELFHKCLNGCHITQDCKSYCQDGGSSLCPYCACSDSRFHRFWVCERFAAERSSLSLDVLRLIPTLPDFLTGYGWSIRPSTFLSWCQYFSALEVQACHAMTDTSHDMHVFTDGSCINQAFPTCRVAAWAAVVADFEQSHSHVLDSGPMPGLLQSSYRAEIFAVLRALSVLRLQTGRIFIWSDCKAVVSKLSRLLEGKEPKPNSTHSDLWMQVFECLRDFSSGQVVITKVAAHRSVEGATSPLEEWCAFHNSLADQAAARAQMKRAEGFWTLFEQHVGSTLSCRRISREVQSVLLDISKAVLRDDDVPRDEERAEVAAPAPVPAQAWNALGPLLIPPAAVRWYGDATVRSILSWYWQATFDSPCEVIWVSQYHLYLDYEMSGGRAPTKLDCWRDGNDTPHLDLLSVPFQTRARWFCKVLKESLRHHGQGFTYAYCRPHSRAVFLHTGSLAVPWCPSRIGAIDDWILRFCPGGVHRQSRSMENLPLAGRKVEFQQIWISSA